MNHQQTKDWNLNYLTLHDDDAVEEPEDDSVENEDDSIKLLGIKPINQEVPDDDSALMTGKTGSNEEEIENMTSTGRDAFTKANAICLKLGLMKQSTPGLGNCLIQTCMISLHNRDSRLCEDEEYQLSTMRRFASYLALNRKLMHQALINARNREIIALVIIDSHAQG